jgi:transposase
MRYNVLAGKVEASATSTKKLTSFSFLWEKNKIMARGVPPAAAIPMTERQYRLLDKESRKGSVEQQIHIRTQILLRGSEGQSNSQVARDLGKSLNTIKAWRRRWQIHFAELLEYEKGIGNRGVSDSELLQRMLSLLRDLPRPGTPKRITLEQEQQIVALACKKPKEYGIEMTGWTHEMLAKVAISEGVLQTISPRYVGVILKKNQATTS